MENWISIINYDFPGRANFSRKMRGPEIYSAYGSEDNNVMFRRNSSSKGFTDEPTTSGENTSFASRNASVHGRRKQPNTEMREKLLTNISKTLQQSTANNFDENFTIDELPCSKEGAKWAKIRMYQERARRREARRRRQREKEREESRGRKSQKRKSRKRSKSRKRRKSTKRSKSRKRSKSKGRKKSGKSRRKSRSRSRRRSISGSRRRSRSGSRRRSRSGSRKKSAKRTARRTRRRNT